MFHKHGKPCFNMLPCVHMHANGEVYKRGGNQFLEEEGNKKERKETKEKKNKREKEKKGREKEGEKVIGVSMVETYRTKK